MSLTVGGVPLTVMTPAIQKWVDDTVVIHEMEIFDYPAWPGLRHAHLPFRPWSIPPVKFGKFCWPQGASRFAVGYFCCTASDLVLLRPLAFGSTGPQPLPMIMSDESNPLEFLPTTVYCLNPYPLQRMPKAITVGQDPIYADAIADALTADQIGTGTSAGWEYPDNGENDLFLLPVVDVRYFWWNKSSTQSCADLTTWQSLFEWIGYELGVSILNTDQINSAYLSPSWRFLSDMRPLPILLDAAAMQVGMRIVRRLDGTVTLQDVDSAFQDEADNYQRYQQAAGGRILRSDLQKSVPASVNVVFDRAFYPLEHSPYSINVPLTSLELGSYANVSGMPDYTKIVVADRPAQFGDPSLEPNNYADLLALARQTAKDWYLWQMEDEVVQYAGILPWNPNGTNDWVIWTYQLYEEADGVESRTRGRALTKIQRHPIWENFTPTERELRDETQAVEITGPPGSDGLSPCSVLVFDPDNRRLWAVGTGRVFDLNGIASGSSSGFVTLVGGVGITIVNLTSTSFEISIGAGQLINSMYSPGSVTGDTIANATILASNIVNNTLTASQIANNTLTSSQIANQTILASNILDGEVFKAGDIIDAGEII